jgi:hypothetical protein
MNAESLASNRRSVYRIHPKSNDPVALTLVTSRGEVPAKEIVDLTINGACTRFPRGTTPAIGVGDRVTLLVHSPGLSGHTPVEATVVKGVEMESEWRYRFRFDRADELLHRATRDFYKLFNRRANFRGVKPAPDDELSVEVRLPPQYSDDTLYPAGVRNISVNGLCIEVDRDLDADLMDTEVVDVRIVLPGDEVVETGARVRHRAEQGGVICYGLKFVWANPQDSLDHMEAILEYMLERFEGELQEVAH